MPIPKVHYFHVTNSMECVISLTPQGFANNYNVKKDGMNEMSHIVTIYSQINVVEHPRDELVAVLTDLHD